MSPPLGVVSRASRSSPSIAPSKRSLPTHLLTCCVDRQRADRAPGFGGMARSTSPSRLLTPSAVGPLGSSAKESRDRATSTNGRARTNRDRCLVALLVRILHLGLAVTGAMALLAVRPKVQLAEDEVNIAVSPDDLLAELRRRFAQDPDDILAMDEHRLVRRFAGKEGPYSFRTVELVTYEYDAITFEHLAGPFTECHERFEFTACPNGTRVTHTGSFRLRGGLWTALLAIGPVKRAFETHVHRHLDALATELAGYPETGHPDRPMHAQ